jgi:hypothetical protein
LCLYRPTPLCCDCSVKIALDKLPTDVDLLQQLVRDYVLLRAHLSCAVRTERGHGQRIEDGTKVEQPMLQKLESEGTCCCVRCEHTASPPAEGRMRPQRATAMPSHRILHSDGPSVNSRVAPAGIRPQFGAGPTAPRRLTPMSPPGWRRWSAFTARIPRHA